jgi:acyl transferase domain-containing protein
MSPNPSTADTSAQVAIVGLGCRFPGDIGDPAAFWELLTAGTRTAGDLPEQRWRAYRERGGEYESVLRRTVTAGNYLGDVAGFDAEFFGISPREAAEMDPQQRLLLEVTWEALEHAGIVPGRLGGTDTGVFVGVSTTDYGDRLLEDLPSIEAYTGIGASTAAIANRISYAYDLRGPSMAVDTACSASLVAVHLACQSLRAGDSEVALAGGVNLVLTPGQNISLQAAGTLAPDGISKSFAADADGYGRGEGCGVLVLKRLADAVRDGDRVLAVIRGSAVNQDGHTNGIMAPSAEAQEHVVRNACDRAGVPPASVGYVEAHGTGTAVGDPIEASALAAVYGAGRADGRPVLIGSVKSNIGHLEGAAGVAGLIKAVLALRHAEIPKTPVHGSVNPELAAVLRLVTENTAWPPRDTPRRAAVSGFGYGGTIAHVILEEAPREPGLTPAGSPAVRALPVSAGSEAALRLRAAGLADRLDAGEPAGAVAATSAHRRAHLLHRAVVSADTATGLTAGLRALAAGTPAADVVTGSAEQTVAPVWVFSGHGAQWPGMGRDLLRHEPAFAAAIDEIEPVVAEEAGFSLRQALGDDALGAVDRLQITTFAMHLGLAALWRHYGVRPAAVIGHSVGEIAAAVTAGVLTAADGARLICRRSLLLRAVDGKGAMAMVMLPFEQVADRLSGTSTVVAAIASAPGTTVVSGDIDAVDAIIEQWPAERIAVRRVQSTVAFHSPHMDPLVDALVKAAADLSPAAAQLPFYSTVLADPRAVPAGDGAYWAANLRQPVRLAETIAAAVADGHRAFLEISAHPVVAHSIRESLDHAGIDDYFVGTTLRRHAPAHRRMATAVAEAHCHGVEVDWRSLQPAGDLIDLPAYPWQHREHWREPAATGAAGHDLDAHTLLGPVTTVAGTALRMWQTVLTDGNRPYPGEHTVLGTEIVPAAVLVSTFLGTATGEGRPAQVLDLEMRLPLLTAGRQEIQVVDNGAGLLLAARPAGTPGAEWSEHAGARAGDGAEIALPDRLQAPPPGAVTVDPALVRDRLAQVGVPGTGFGWTVERLLAGDGLLRARVRAGGSGWAALLDAVFSIAPAVFAGEPALRMVDRVASIRLDGSPPELALVQVVLDESSDDLVHVALATLDGRIVAELRGLRYPVIATSAPAGSADRESDSLSRLAPEDLLARLVDEVGALIAGQLKLAPEALHPRRPLLNQGMDSVTTVVVRRKLEKRYGQVLPAALFWQQPTVTGIAEYLSEALGAAPEPAAAV